MPEASPRARPLSPHLQVFRMLVTMIVSGLHRITGLGLVITAFLLVWWFVALASGPQYFEFVDGLLDSWIGRLVMLVSLWGLMHHLLNGIRHLIWDTGRGFEMEQILRGAWIVLIGAPVLAVIALIVMMLG